MKLRVNGVTQEVENNLAVAQLIEKITGEKDPQGVAVAVNGNVVARSNWREQSLRPNDDIEILGAVSGG